MNQEIDQLKQQLAQAQGEARQGKWSDSKREKWNKATAGLQGRLRELSKDSM